MIVLNELNKRGNTFGGSKEYNVLKEEGDNLRICYKNNIAVAYLLMSDNNTPIFNPAYT